MKDHHAATVKRQPVKPPKVSGRASLAPVNVGQIVNDAMLECVHHADFSQSNLSGADVRRSALAGVHLGPDQLRGLIVTPDQALYLAGAIGLKIEA